MQVEAENRIFKVAHERLKTESKDVHDRLDKKEVITKYKRDIDKFKHMLEEVEDSKKKQDEVVSEAKEASEKLTSELDEERCASH